MGDLSGMVWPSCFYHAGWAGDWRKGSWGRELCRILALGVEEAVASKILFQVKDVHKHKRFSNRGKSVAFNCLSGGSHPGICHCNAGSGVIAW